LIKANPSNSDDYDFTFKNQNDPNKVIQNIKVDQSRSKVIDNIINNNNVPNFNFLNNPSYSNPDELKSNSYQTNTNIGNSYNYNGNIGMNLVNNSYNQGNNSYLPNNINNSYVYQNNPQQKVPLKNDLNFVNYQNYQQPQANTYNNNTSTSVNLNNINNGNFNYPSTNFDLGVSNDNQIGSNLGFFDTIKPNSNMYMNQNMQNNQIQNQNNNFKNNTDDLNKLDEFF
jgi:hypothetical protein